MIKYFDYFCRTTNHKIILETFERSAALQRLERLRLYMFGGEIQDNMLHQERDLFEEHRDILLHLAQRQSKTKKFNFFFRNSVFFSNNLFITPTKMN